MSKDNDTNVYMFHNIKHNIFLFVNCKKYDDAMETFDLSSFENREEWKIFLECGDQHA